MRIRSIPFSPSTRCVLVVAVMLFLPIFSRAEPLLLTPTRAWLPALRGATEPSPPPSPAPETLPSHDGARHSDVLVPLTFWTGRSLDLIVKYRQNPLRASRTLAYVHTALHDALLLTREDRPAVQYAAAHKAASCVLAFLYPQESAGRLEAQGIAAIYKSGFTLTSAEETRVERASRAVIDATIARAWQDGAERVWPIGSRPAFETGQWKEAPPLRIVTPTEALAGSWKTWVLKDGGDLRPPSPPSAGSATETAEMAEVLNVSRLLTESQKAIARRWNLDQGTITPPGVWNKLALSFAKEWGLDDSETIVVLAAMNAGMLDAFIACWHAKFTWWTRRPITAIRESMDPEFMPLLLTPPFPGYVSGHATVSGSASTILAGFFPERREQLRALAEEAALSRLYGGIHMRSDNDEGLALGRAIGTRVVSHLQVAGRAASAFAPVAGTGNR